MKRKIIRYGDGSYTPAPTGRGYDVTIWIDGDRHRKRVETIDLAKAFIDSHMVGVAPMSREQINDARDALSILPAGWSLVKAVQMCVGTLSPEPRRVHDCIDEFLLAMVGSNSGRTAKTYKCFLKRLAETCRKEFIGEIAADDIQQSLGHYTRTTYNTSLTHVRAFFAWCRKRKYIAADPALEVEKVKSPEPPKGVLTPAEWSKFFTIIESDKKYHSSAVYFALGCFAGIRPAELLRLPMTAIGREYIRLDGSVTKTADARSVPIESNLRKWLDAYLPGLKKIAPLSERRMYNLAARIRRDAGLTRWPHDCMRHSYASYHYERGKNSNETAANMGHVSTDVFFRHYRALAEPGDGVKFFGIEPANRQPKRQRKLQVVGKQARTSYS